MRQQVGERRQSAIDEIRSYGQSPLIVFPNGHFSPFGFQLTGFSVSDGRFKYREFPVLFQDKPYEEILADVTRIFSLYANQPFPSEAYWLFHHYTEADLLVLEQYVESWIREATSSDMVESYFDSEEYVCLGGGFGSDSYVFKWTNYTVTRRKAIESAEEALLSEQANLESETRERKFAEAILRSSYEVFTYLMEDTRNGLIKIGKSKNPERREKTLQSEAPSVELRIAVPTENNFEQELHNLFDHLRRRGEWFELTSADTKDVIERLLANGDATRAITSHDWLGAVFLGAFVEQRITG